MCAGDPTLVPGFGSGECIRAYRDAGATKIQGRLTRPQAQGINDSSEVIQHIVYCLRPADVVGRRLGRSLRHCGYSRRESRTGASRTW